MKYISMKIGLAIAALFGGVAAASDLPDCPSDTNVRWHNCFGTITLSDGGKYVGEWRDNEKTGQGTMTWLNGDKYIGEFKDDKRTGQGTYTWPDGGKYVGEFEDGKRNGQGAYTYLNGDKYVGQFKDSKHHGQGSYTYSNGEQYVGQYKDGKRYGQGTYTYPNGRSYVGEWKDGKSNGQGIETYADGTIEEGVFKDDEFQYAKVISARPDFVSNLPDCPSNTDVRWNNCFGTSMNGVGIYVGEYKDDKQSGQGTYTYSPNGEYAGMKYVGEWKENTWNGQGSLTYTDGAIDEGIWKEGVFQYAMANTVKSGVTSNLTNCPSDRNVSWHNCFGTFTFANGDKYVGEFKGDKRNGQGIYTNVNGAKYAGQYKDNKRSGQGTQIYADGDKYVGEWKDGKVNGLGTETYADGDKYVGEFKDDARSGQGTYTYVSGAKYIGGHKDNKRNGQGTYTYPNGNQYIGQYKDGKKNGQGTFTWANGDKYAGQYKDSSRTGQGTYIFGAKSEWAGDTYVGQFKDGEKNGQGSYTYADGTVKEGIWENDEFQYASIAVAGAESNLPNCPSDPSVRWHNCFGTFTYDDGAIYIGEWQDNKRTGQGVTTYLGGGKHIGEYKGDKRNGQGTYTYADGSKYVGLYKDGKKSGQGIYTYLNGDKYVGQFKDGDFNGQGSFTYTDGKVEKGIWKDDEFQYADAINGESGFVSDLPDCPSDTNALWNNCFGTITFASGSKYVGEFKGDKRSGQGEYIYADGDKYVGEWKDSNKNGQGTYTYGPESEWAGDKYVGQFKDNKFSGQGTYTFADGQIKEGIFKDDKFQYAKAISPSVPVAKAPTQDDEVISASSGSGFAVSSDGYVITNNHVIEGCQEVMVHTKQNDIKMRVITYDTQNDLALLKGDFTPLSVFSLSTKRPELLQDVYVAGYPFGNKFSTSVKVTKGIISSLTGMGNNFSNIQIDAALQSGNSGGPILDEMGNVVAVAVSKLDAKYMFDEFGIIPENTNFGIKSSVVRTVLDSSGIDTPTANNSPISKSQLVEMITDGTYYISCWMTLAQIEKVRSKKVLFSELD
jgi:hypothetical protein